jgi:hypothetical protein
MTAARCYLSAVSLSKGSNSCTARQIGAQPGTPQADIASITNKQGAKMRKSTGLGAALAALLAGCNPIWEIKETRLDETHFRIDMRMKRVTIGGVGESMDLFHHQADEIAIQTHSPGYTIVSFSEGIDSTFPIAQRWSRGVIEVEPAPVKVDER